MEGEEQQYRVDRSGFRAEDARRACQRRLRRTRSFATITARIHREASARERDDAKAAQLDTKDAICQLSEVATYQLPALLFA